MPPKAKYTKEEIVATALHFVQEEGMDALTARALGERLGSSARPIFTVFSGMDAVQKAVLDAAKTLYRKSYVEQGLAEAIPFKGVGMAYIRFASEEPKLFQLLFMRETEVVPSGKYVLGIIEESYEKIMDSIRTSYGLNEDDAYAMYTHLWIFSHGIAVLCATKVCRFSTEEISDMLTTACKGFLLQNRPRK